MPNATSPFNQPVGQALVQAAQLIVSAGQRRQQIELQREQFDFQKKQAEEMLKQRESTLKMKEEEFVLRQQIEQRRQEQLDLDRAEEEGTTPRAALEFEKLEAETELLKKRRQKLETEAPDKSARVKLLEERLEASLRGVGGEFSELTVAQLQGRLTTVDQSIQRQKSDPIRMLLKTTQPGQQLPLEASASKMRQALGAKLDARNTYFHGLPPEDKALFRDFIGGSVSTSEDVRTVTDEGDQLVPQPETGDLGADTRSLLESIDKNRIQTDATFRKNSLSAVSRQIKEARRNGLDDVSMRAIQSEVLSRFGQEFLSELIQVGSQ